MNRKQLAEKLDALRLPMPPCCYFWREGAEIVGQNWIGGMEGQTHRHTLEDWERWRADAEQSGWDIEELKKVGA